MSYKWRLIVVTKLIAPSYYGTSNLYLGEIWNGHENKRRFN